MNGKVKVMVISIVVAGRCIGTIETEGDLPRVWVESGLFQENTIRVTVIWVFQNMECRVQVLIVCRANRVVGMACHQTDSLLGCSVSHLNNKLDSTSGSFSSSSRCPAFATT